MVNRHKGLLLEIPEGTIQNNIQICKGNQVQTSAESKSFCEQAATEEHDHLTSTLVFRLTDLMMIWVGLMLTFALLQIPMLMFRRMSFQSMKRQAATGTILENKIAQKKIDCHCYMETKNMCNTSWRKRISCIKTCIL